MPGFQNAVRTVPAPGVEGEFATTNPRQVVLAGPGGLVAGLAGVTVARFGWLSDTKLDSDDAPAVVNNFGSGPVAGITHREQQALIQNYLQEFSMTIPAGFETSLFSACDIWVKNRGATAAVVGQKCYASYADGSASFAASGAPGTASATGSIAAGTASFTGSITDNLLTVTAVGSGSVYPGQTLSGTNVISGTVIDAQELPLLAGEALNGVGRYSVSPSEQTVASTTISATYGIFTAASALSGLFGAGDTLSGSSVVAGTKITQQLTGPAGGLGTYAVSNNTVVSSTTVTAGTTVETKWIAMSAGQVGDIIKISSQPLG